MGLFGNYTKEGPGISKDEPEKTGFFRFFDVLGRKFGKLLKLNMLYFAVSIPYLLILFFISTKVVSFMEFFDLTAVAEDAINDVYWVDFMMRLFLIAMIFIFWGAGPVTPGYIYNIRNFAREEHTWLVSDFFEKIKENWKQSLLVTVMDLAVFFMAALGIRFYWIQAMTEPMWNIPRVIMIVLLGIYTMMHTYIYQIMVTFKTSFVQTLKNALTMTVAKFPMNLLLTLFAAALCAVSFYYGSLIWLLTVPFIFTALCSFIMNFYATSMIKKNFIDPYEDEKPPVETLFEDVLK